MLMFVKDVLALISLTAFGAATLAYVDMLAYLA